jgi:chlorite dismutase
MRFDEVSARYAEFGPFLLGIRVRPDDLPGVLPGS